MQFFATVALLAASVAASPAVAPAVAAPSLNTMTVQQAANSCSDGQSVYCCNEVNNEANGNAIGNGPELLNNLGAFKQCSKLQVDVIAIANNLIQKECQATAACCQDSPGTAAGGLVNAALPCVAISNIA
ncbi:hypothetical protein ACLX1H_004541 [Fusarium chlamydosporum]